MPDARIAIVGDGPEREALGARAAALGLDARVAFLPFTGPASRHLRALDVYVLPSAWEAFPIGVLEAQACGVPQVATDVGGTREAVVPETGVLVPPRDPGALALALVRAAARPRAPPRDGRGLAPAPCRALLARADARRDGRALYAVSSLKSTGRRPTMTM